MRSSAHNFPSNGSSTSRTHRSVNRTWDGLLLVLLSLSYTVGRGVVDRATHCTGAHRTSATNKTRASLPSNRVEHRKTAPVRGQRN